MKPEFRAWYEPDAATKDGWLKFSQKEIDGEMYFVMDKDKGFVYPLSIPFEDSQWIVEQYTTLNDKKGAKIFAGDIIKLRGRTNIVYWENSESAAFTGWGVCEFRYFKNLSDKGYTHGKAFTPAKARRSEIVGNHKTGLS